jgi:hypothetical protein
MTRNSILHQDTKLGKTEKNPIESNIQKSYPQQLGGSRHPQVDNCIFLFLRAKKTRAKKLGVYKNKF